jgi:hypothetical protein
VLKKRTRNYTQLAARQGAIVGPEESGAPPVASASIVQGGAVGGMMKKDGS